MAKIDDIVQQIRNAKAEAIRTTKPSDGTITERTTKILQKNLAAQQAIKQTSDTSGQVETPALPEVTDTRTTQQKYDDVLREYDGYVSSEEHRQKQAENNRAALQEAMQRIFTSGSSAADLPLNVAQVSPRVDTREQELKATVEHYKRQMDAEANRAVQDADFAEYETWSEEDRANLDRYIAERDRKFYNSLNPAMSDAFITANDLEVNPIVEKYGQQRVNEMAESITRQRNQQITEQMKQAAQKSAGKNFLSGTAHSLLSVPANILGGITGLVGLGKEGQQRTGRYTTLDANNEGNLLGAYASAVRGEVAGNIAGDEYSETGEQTKDGGAGRQILSYGYQGIMSLADSISRGLAFGPAGGAALAASSSFAQTVSDASRSGATPQQAVTLGVATAGMEYISEKIPMDEVFKLAKGGKANVLKQAFKQAGIEITTEELSLFGSMAAEAAILQEKSSYRQQIGDLVANGASYEEAKAQADKGVWNEVLQTAAVSGFAGGFSGGGAAIVGNLATNNAPAVTEEAQQEQPVQIPPAAPVVEPMQQTGPYTEQLLEGIRDMSPPPAPLPEGLQHFDNAAAIANGVQSAQQSAADTTLAAETPAEESTVINTDPAQHTLEEQATIDAYQNSIDDNLVAYIEAVRNNPGQKMPRYPLKNVDTRAADDIKRLTGIDTTGNKTQIEARAVEHILKRHGEHGNGDHSMRDVNDIARIQYVIDNYDSMEHGGKTSAYVYQNEKGRNVHAQTVVIKKKVNGTYFVVEAVPDTKKKTLFVVSAYMSQNGQKETAPSLSGDAEAYRVTSDNATKSDAVSNNSIPENVAQVNGNYSFEHLGRANAAIAEFRQSDEYRAMSHDQRVQAINEIIDYFVRVVDENEPGVAVVSDRDQQSTQDVDTSKAVQMDASNIQRQSTEDVQGIRGTGAAEQNFSGKAAYQNLLYEGNVQRDRPGDVRPVEVPKTDLKGKKVSETVGNFYGASITSDEMANRIESLVQEGALSYDSRTNKQSLENAASAIQKTGEESTRSTIAKNIGQRKIQDGDIEKALLLYTKDANDPNRQEAAAEMMVQLQEMATITGRNLQLFRLVRRMTPEGQLMAVQKEVRNNTEKMVKSGAVKKGFEPTIDPQLEQDFLQAAKDAQNAKSDESRHEAEQKMQEIQNSIYVNAASQMPSTFKAKWDAWRYMAMLGNVKTQARNLAGNLAFKPYKEVKDKMGALAEKVFVSKDQRTKSLFTDQSLVKWARQDAKTRDVHDALKYSAKLGDDVSTQKIRDNMQVFNNKALDSVRKFVESVPSAGDMLFKNNYYVRSLAGFLKARGYKATDIQSGKVSDTILAEARAYAIQEAMKATFNDSNAFSDFMATGLRYKGDNPFGKALNIAAEGVLPFRRTPANIAVRFSEYSPVGVAKGLWSAATKVRNGEMTAATAVDQLASGLTGSAVMALGFALAGGMNGIKITGSGADEDEKRQGHQDYALEFSVDGQEYSYKIDWAAPANLPLFVGANIYNALEKAGENTDVSKFTSFIRGMGTAFEPMLALSCMSGLNNLLEGARYAEEGEVLYSIVAEAATGYFTQGIPALVRQTYQATQENKQTTFTKSDDPTIRDLQQTAASIPFVGAEYQTDKRNAWGEKEEQGDWMTRTFNSFVNPGTLKKIDNSAVEQEITRLNKAGYNVTPNTAARTVSYIDKDGYGHDDVRLTEEQFQKLAETQGQTARKLLDDMISSASYAALTDEQKADAIDTAYLYARKTGEIAAIEDHTGYDQSWFYDVEKGGANEIVRRVLNSGLNTSMSDLDTAWDRGYDEETFNRELQTAYESYRYAPAEMRKQVYAEAEGTAKKYIEVRDKGISHTDALAAIKNVATVKGTGSINKETGKPTVRDIDRRQAIATTPNITDKAKDTLIKAYMADYDPDADKKDYTELKYNYIREYLGLSPEQYAEVYRAVLDEPSDKKDDDVVVALGYDKKTAKAIADVFNGTRSGKRAYLNWYKKNM